MAEKRIVAVLTLPELAEYVTVTVPALVPEDGLTETQAGAPCTATVQLRFPPPPLVTETWDVPELEERDKDAGDTDKIGLDTTAAS